MAVKYATQARNSRLTDFEGLRDYVVRNVVKGIPRVIKERAYADNSLLSEY